MEKSVESGSATPAGSPTVSTPSSDSDDAVGRLPESGVASVSSTPDRIRRRLSHNPSPPPELQAAGARMTGDAIGDTLFSERWVLQTLMKLSEVVSDKTLGIAANDDDEDAADFVEELNGDVEDILCQLWDMSANKDVVLFLLGLPTLDLVADAMTRTKIPRLTEIVAGIAANMACVNEACQKLTEHDKLKTVALQLLDVSDPPTLTELFRFLLTCTRNESLSSTWLNLYREDNHFLPHLTFIMSSSTNSQLLKMSAEFVDHVLDLGDDFCSDWSSMEFVDSLIEAVQQVGFKFLIKLKKSPNYIQYRPETTVLLLRLDMKWVRDKDTVETYLHILQLLSTSDKGKEALLHHADAVIKVASLYMAHLCSEDCFHIVGRESGLASAVRLMHVLLLTSPDSTVDLFRRDKSLHFVTKLTKAFKTKPDANTSNNDFTNGDMSAKIESALLRKLLEESLVMLTEELLNSEKGTELLLKELSSQDEISTRTFLFWAKMLPECQQCYRKLMEATKSGAHNYNQLSDAFEKLESTGSRSNTNLDDAPDKA